MAYHFPLMPRIYMAIAQEDRFPIADILRQTPDIPDNCQWALFLRNHDELTLEMVTDVERDYLWSAYAADPRTRLNLGIRRRLAPLMDNDRRKIELMNSLLMSFPGTPIIYYGDEIGMGDNIYLGDRNGVRTPMQWTPDRNGGFSRVDPARLYAPTIMDPVYGYEAINVEAQSRSLGSLLSWTKRIISVRKSSQVFGRGSLTFVRPANRSVLVYLRQYGNEALLCIANLSRSAQSAEIDLSPWRGRVPVEMLGRQKFPPIGDVPYHVTLAPYGFFWFLLCEQAADPAEMRRLGLEFETLVVAKGPASLWNGRTRAILERDVLPNFLATRRWFPERSAPSINAHVETIIPVGNELDIALIEAKGRRKDRYVMPLAIKWQRMDREHRDPNALAAVRQGSREGMLIDTAADPEFISALLDRLRRRADIDAEDGRRVEFSPVDKLSVPDKIENVRAVDTEQSNTSVLVGSDCVVKLFRRLDPGINPEIEVGRFLTEIAPFANTPPMLGAAELVEDRARHAVAVVHRFVENQGDAWTVTNAYLDRYVEEERLLSTEPTEETDEQAAYLARIRQAGVRIAEMQLALASRDDIPDFAPEPITADDISEWSAQFNERAERVIDELARRRSDLREDDRRAVDELSAQRRSLPSRVRELLPNRIGGMKIRHHGDFHLGQMLIVKDDVFIIDFEGEPRRSLAERRRKAPAARDLAGLIRSIDYSATAALDRALRSAPDEHGKIGNALVDWRERAVDTVLGAYHERLTDPRLWPQDRDKADRLLDFFLLEKVFYEIEYELSYRPDWVRVPVRGALRILMRQEALVA
jgi:maltose alpha-D-glucosyltransferase/alpha-amylase